MTPNKQVSPAIRILRGERDASARATHLEAATRKFLVATNERKQMSTMTNFKRIALVAVAALGMGVLSSVPSQATFLTQPTITVVDGTASKALADSSTAGSITISWNADATADSVTVSAITQSYPSGAGTSVPQLAAFFGDTVGSTAAVPTPTGRLIATGATYGEASAKFVPERAGESLTLSASTAVIMTTVAGKNVMKLLPQIDTAAAVARFAGTYSYLIAVTPYSAGVKGTVVTATYNVVIAALATESKVASAGTSTAFLHSSASTVPTADASISASATSSTTVRGYVYVNLLNTGSAQASESVTITTTIGSIGVHGGTAGIGKNVTLQYSSGPNYYPIFSDGTAGTAVITVKSSTVTFANKSMVFFATAPTSIALTLINAQPGVGTTEVIRAAAKDANGNVWGGTLNIYSDTVGTISDTATACSASTVASKGYHTCSVTGVIPGTAKVKVMDASQAVASAEQSLTITNDAPATIKLSWDKASYSPGERGILFVDVLSSAGKSIPAANHQNAFATGGITLNVASGNGSDTVTGTSILTRSPIANSVGTGSDIRGFYVVYMPVSGGTVTATAKGGTLLPAAGQVTVTASATITDSGAAALAAVAALATTVASLKTLITTLTNLVLKIQKKVKA